MKTPRPYQQELLRGVSGSFRRGNRNVLMQSPTGSGKSVMIAHMIRSAVERRMTAHLLCHRRELLEQLSATLWEAGVPHGHIAAGKRYQPHLPVQVGSVLSYVRRLDRVPPPSLLAVDEAHHAPAASYRKILSHCARSFTVGLTATPVRTDGSGLDDLFQDMVLGPKVRWLIDEGYLAPFRVIRPPEQVSVQGVGTSRGDFKRGELEARVDRSVVVGDAVDHYLRHVYSPKRPTVCLVYCVSRKHARHVEAEYRSRGINARYVAGDTPDADRKRYIEGMAHADPAVIVSVDLFGEGLDVPRLDAVQLLRPTQSLALHLQQVGRALRPMEGKTAIILDHAGNTYRHGLPDEDFEWSLKGTPKRRRSEEELALSLRTCKTCYAIFPAHQGSCPACGEEPQVDERRALPETVEGELIEVDLEAVRAQRRREEGRARGMEELLSLAKERGYNPAWAGIRHSLRTGMPRAEAIRLAYRTMKTLEHA